MSPGGPLHDTAWGGHGVQVTTPGAEIAVQILARRFGSEGQLQQQLQEQQQPLQGFLQGQPQQAQQGQQHPQHQPRHTGLQGSGVAELVMHLAVAAQSAQEEQAVQAGGACGTPGGVAAGGGPGAGMGAPLASGTPVQEAAEHAGAALAGTANAGAEDVGSVQATAAAQGVAGVQGPAGALLLDPMRLLGRSCPAAARQLLGSPDRCATLLATLPDRVASSSTLNTLRHGSGSVGGGGSVVGDVRAGTGGGCGGASVDGAGGAGVSVSAASQHELSAEQWYASLLSQLAMVYCAPEAAWQAATGAVTDAWVSARCASLPEAAVTEAGGESYQRPARSHLSLLLERNESVMPPGLGVQVQAAVKQVLAAVVEKAVTRGHAAAVAGALLQLMLLRNTGSPADGLRGAGGTHGRQQGVQQPTQRPLQQAAVARLLRAVTLRLLPLGRVFERLFEQLLSRLSAACRTQGQYMYCDLNSPPEAQYKWVRQNWYCQLLSAGSSSEQGHAAGAATAGDSGDSGGNGGGSGGNGSSDSDEAPRRVRRLRRWHALKALLLLLGGPALHSPDMT